MAGADAVGMSTVSKDRGPPRQHACWLCISNKANLDGSTVTTHEEVMEAGKTITPKIEALVRGVLQDL
jgi:purine-nucleoside phosphorylase